VDLKTRRSASTKLTTPERPMAVRLAATIGMANRSTSAEVIATLLTSDTKPFVVAKRANAASGLPGRSAHVQRRCHRKL
jgi:hypothetical protein